MFAVIICTVNTGRVAEKLFDSHDEATQYANDWLEKKITPKPGKLPTKSASDYRILVEYREMPVIRTLESLTPVEAA
jgi:hypothetical protein